MGFLKSSANDIVSCDNVISVKADSTSEPGTLNVIVKYGISMGEDQTVGSALLYGLSTSLLYRANKSGSSNEMELTEAEYQKIFADAITSMSGVSGPGVSLPIVNNKVIASGEVIGAVTPTIQLDYFSIDL